MSEQVLLSIITPSYNSGRFIERCIQNVIAQNVSNIEHIIQDGCSADATSETVEKYLPLHPHLRFYSEKDSGQSDAMNKGIRKARGKFITFLNADDYFEPDSLQWVLQQLLELGDADILVGNCFVRDLKGNIKTLRKPSNCGYPQILQIWRPDVFPSNPSSYFYSKKLHDIAGYYDENENFVLDYEMMIRLLKKASVHYHDRAIGNFVLHEDTKTFHNSSAGNKITKLKVYTRYKKELPLSQRLILNLQFFYHMKLKRSNNPIIFFSLRPHLALKKLGL